MRRRRAWFLGVFKSSHFLGFESLLVSLSPELGPLGLATVLDVGVKGGPGDKGLPVDAQGLSQLGIVSLLFDGQLMDLMGLEGFVVVIVFGSGGVIVFGSGGGGGVGVKVLEEFGATLRDSSLNGLFRETPLGPELVFQF